MQTLSVLITYFNEKDLLTECLRTLVSQDQGPDEILIYDDASTFPAKNYLVADSRIRVIRGEKNKGPSFGRNTLLSEATGSYIHFHDADDWFNPGWCKAVRAALSQRNADAVYSEIISFFPNGTVYMPKVLGLREVTDHDSLIRFCIRRFMLVPAATYRRELVKENGGYRTDLWQSEDYEFNLRMALNVGTFEVLGEALVSIRLREESRSRNKIETNNYTLEAILQLKSEVPRAYWRDLSEKAADVGRKLWGLKEIASARRAFRVARSLGPAHFQDEGKFYRFLARSLGQEMAERIGEFYRNHLPVYFRSKLR